MRWERINEIIDIYPQVDLFLLIVDRDGDQHRRLRLENLENRAAALFVGGRRLFADHACKSLRCGRWPGAMIYREHGVGKTCVM
jgi:hypothetical protein